MDLDLTLREGMPLPAINLHQCNVHSGNSSIDLWAQYVVEIDTTITQALPACSAQNKEPQRMPERGTREYTGPESLHLSLLT